MPNAFKSASLSARFVSAIFRYSERNLITWRWSAWGIIITFFDVANIVRCTKVCYLRVITLLHWMKHQVTGGELYQNPANLARNPAYRNESEFAAGCILSKFKVEPIVFHFPFQRNNQGFHRRRLIAKECWKVAILPNSIDRRNASERWGRLIQWYGNH